MGGALAGAPLGWVASQPFLGRWLGVCVLAVGACALAAAAVYPLWREDESVEDPEKE